MTGCRGRRDIEPAVGGRHQVAADGSCGSEGRVSGVARGRETGFGAAGGRLDERTGSAGPPGSPPPGSHDVGGTCEGEAKGLLEGFPSLEAFVVSTSLTRIQVPRVVWVCHPPEASYPFNIQSSWGKWS